MGDRVKVLEDLRVEFAGAAQRAYDAWDQNDDGEDPELGVGGICQDVAAEISGVLGDHGIDHAIVDNNGVGEQHVWVVALVDNRSYSIDINPHTYETGSGYTWRKRPGVVFGPNHLEITEVGGPEVYRELINESLVTRIGSALTV